ncbi:MAG: hypothetical protein A2026_16545 [Deltaproteobacteria bacterium RBG_19FT_COMBO_46_12]|nr:MAG: hypothetical protein A2026_16545 [Deltaproteobacteria bacterium RBG_19FT_COMBO_46_12]
MAIRKIIFLLSIFALFCFHPFVSVAEERPFSLNFWPFFQYFSDPIQGTKEIGGLGPFFSWKKDPQRRQWGIRPLLYWTEDEKESLRRLEYIYPLGKYQVKDGEKKKGFHFWPIYGRRETFGISKSEFFLWLVFLKQTTGMDTDDPVEERMIFPFYLSKESIHFESKTFLWPFFSYARDRLTGFEQLDLPWPFFQSLKGEKLYGIKFFPFYGYKEREGDMKRNFVLYPLYQWEEDQMRETEERSHRILLLMRIRSGEDRQGVKKESSIRVWPFFDYERESTGHTTFSFFYLFPFKDEGFERNLFPLFRVFRWEKDPQKGKEADFLWGFYKRIEREGYDFWEIAHLIGVKRGEASKTVSLLKGLVWYQSDRETADLRVFYLPFHIRWSHQRDEHSKLIQKEFADGGQEDRYIGDWLVSSGEDPYQF